MLQQCRPLEHSPTNPFYFSSKMLKKWIPDLTRFRFDIARHHQRLHGRGAVVPTTEHTRMYVAPGQLSHFMNFITSTHIIQDLPFGERKMKLSSNEELTIPNVIRSVIPAQIISQDEALCSEEGFKPMGRSTLYRVVHVCSASVRKSLQGLDYVSAQGAKAFEELKLAAEKLGDNCGLGLSWVKDKKEKLKVAKRECRSKGRGRGARAPPSFFSQKVKTDLYNFENKILSLEWLETITFVLLFIF